MSTDSPKTYFKKPDVEIKSSIRVIYGSLRTTVDIIIVSTGKNDRLRILSVLDHVGTRVDSKNYDDYYVIKLNQAEDLKNIFKHDIYITDLFNRLFNFVEELTIVNELCVDNLKEIDNDEPYTKRSNVAA